MRSAAIAIAIVLGLLGSARAESMRVGSKQFTEGVILGEVVTQLGRTTGAACEHRAQLGGTRILWSALLAGEIDVYVEYTGTIGEEILASEHVTAGDPAALEVALARHGVVMLGALGFSDTYGLGMRADLARALGLRTITDLAARRDLVFGLSHEFLDRADGWRGLASGYGLAPGEVRGLVHDLAYRALADGTIDVTDVYTTDAEIARLGLVVLDDDRRYFPAYDAVILARADWATRSPGVVAALARLRGAIDAPAMIAMNARARIDHAPEAQVAADFLAARLGVTGGAPAHDGRTARILARTREHLALVAVALLLAIAAAVPLGVLAARRPVVGQLVLGVVGVLQTVPSLALLVLFIPLVGIGERPAIAAMFAYSLLPIVRNTHAGIVGIAPTLRESADALGLAPWTRLVRIDLPLASPSILAGVKTAAVLSVGTATIGALVGAGGYGQPILAGIRLDDLDLILEGALPAAGLALVVQGVFEIVERWVVPRGLR